MKCPHCLENFHEKWDYFYNSYMQGQNHVEDVEGRWSLRYHICPSCEKVIIQISANGRDWVIVRPKGVSRSPLSAEVPEKFAVDYKEACTVLPDSPKASAALSRRCLQNLLREKAGVKEDNLYNEIQEVLDSNKLPSYLSDGLDAVRNIGNFAAHPTKSKSTGEIVDVETGEAEWTLDILEGLFDFYFVQPEKMKRKQNKLNEKLKDAGRQPKK